MQMKDSQLRPAANQVAVRGVYVLDALSTAPGPHLLLSYPYIV